MHNGELILSYLVRDHGECLLLIKEWVCLTASNCYLRGMRLQKDASSVADQLGYRLLTQKHNSLQSEVHGSVMNRVRGNTCHFTTHIAWSLHLPTHMLNKSGGVVPKQALVLRRMKDKLRVHCHCGVDSTPKHANFIMSFFLLHHSSYSMRPVCRFFIFCVSVNSSVNFSLFLWLESYF